MFLPQSYLEMLILERQVCSQKETGRCWSKFMNEWMNERLTVVQVKCKMEFVLTIKQAQGLWGCLGNWLPVQWMGKWVWSQQGFVGRWERRQAIGTKHMRTGANTDDLTAMLTLLHLLGNEEGHNNVTCGEYTPLPLCRAAAGSWQQFVKTSQWGNTWWWRICLLFRCCQCPVMCLRSCVSCFFISFSGFTSRFFVTRNN